MQNNLKSNSSTLSYSTFIFFKILIPSFMLSALMILLVEISNIQNHIHLPKKSNINMISALLIAPIMETMILLILIKTLQKFDSLKTSSPKIIGIIAAIIHGMQNFESTLSAGWSFYMYTVYFVELRKNIGIKKSFIFSIFMHLAINMVAILIFKMSIWIPGA